jgi:hypothetical protein
VGSWILGRKMRADIAGWDEISTSLDLTPVIGSSDGGILWVDWNFSIRPSLYARKKRIMNYFAVQRVHTRSSVEMGFPDSLKP